MSGEEAMGGAGAAARPRSPRQGAGGSPVGSTLSIVLAVIAVVAGFLILRSVFDSDDAGTAAGTELPSAGTDAPADTLIPPEDLETSTTTTTTTLPPTRTGAVVVVANASRIGGSAGRMTKALESAGYTVGDPTNASGDRLDTSVVYFDPTVAGADAVAAQLGTDLGGVAVEALPTPIPTESAALDGGVLLMLGVTEADVPLADLQAAAGGAETGVAPDPAAAGDTVAATEDDVDG